MEDRSRVKQETNWEKVGVYVAIAATFISVITYIADMKERIRALEVKVEYLQGGKPWKLP